MRNYGTDAQLSFDCFGALPSTEEAENLSNYAQNLLRDKPQQASKRNLVTVEAGGRKSYLYYDDNGEFVQYKSADGEIFDKRGDIWLSRTNVVQPKGVRITEDQSHNVTLTDIGTGVVTSYAADGLECGVYPGGGKTATRTFASKKSIIVESPGQPLRTLEMTDGRLTKYTDRDGNIFSLDGTRWTKTDSKGVARHFNGRLKGDIAGNVFVIDTDKKGTDDYVTSYWNNGKSTNMKQDAPEGCDPVQQTPPNVDIEANMRRAKMHRPHGFGTAFSDAQWFYTMVRNKGEWDYKQHGRQYEAFGNWHYGAVGRAIGFSDLDLLRRAGGAQIEAGTSKPEWGKPSSIYLDRYGLFATGTYGDDPRDQEWIKRGIEHGRKWRAKNG